MANRRRRRQEKSGISGVLYAVVILALLVSMGYLFYYSRSQSKERQEYIKELESKEAATQSFVTEVELETETETESESMVETKAEEETKLEAESNSEIETETKTEMESKSEVESNSEIESNSEEIQQ